MPGQKSSNTELHTRYLLFLFIAQVYFVQEYIYHETAGRMVYIPVQNKRVQQMGIKNNVCKVLYLLHTRCFYKHVKKKFGMCHTHCKKLCDQYLYK